MKTPLNAMLTLLKYLPKYITDPHGHELLSMIKSSSTILECLMNDLIDLF